MTQNPHNTIFGINILIGRKFSDPDVQQSIKNLLFKVVCGQEDTVEVEVKFRRGTKTFTPVEVVALMLVELRGMAEKYTAKTVEKAVMTVPASFNRFQRQALKDAGAVARLNVLRFISSGTAASIAYGFDKKLNNGELNVLVFDLGGGALNVSLVRIELDIYEVKASAADVTLGGQASLLSIV